MISYSSGAEIVGSRDTIPTADKSATMAEIEIPLAQPHT